MSAQRSAGFSRLLLPVNILLLSTAVALPAMAQIETVVVTAQKRTEDVQSVPIAVSAFTAEDMAAHQMKTFNDIQFAMPNVTVSNDTFGSSNFSIRGIGTGSVTTSSDPGVSLNLNENPILNAGVTVTGTSYYDIERIEVDRGPQGTLFGQNATGGAVNVITAKPDLDTFGVAGEFTYGNYNDQEVRAMVNLPIIPGQLAVRAAVFAQSRDGDITNIYPENNPGSGLPDKLNSRNDWSGRGSVRWEPADGTTVDLLYQHYYEDDSRVRNYKQSCTTDPSGILGCLPAARSSGDINLDATTNVAALSDIGLFGGTPFQIFNITGANPANIGLIEPQSNNPQVVNTDFQPINVEHDDFLSLTWKQRISSWLNATLIAGMDHGGGYEEQATEGTPAPSFSNYLATGTNPTSPVQCLSAAVTSTQRGAYACAAYQKYGTFAYLPNGTSSLAAMEALFTGAYPTSGSTYFSGSNFGLAPISAPTGFGLSSGSILDYSDHLQAYDEIAQTTGQKNLELRFQSSLDGPFNFLVGAAYLEYHETEPYYVAQSGTDLASIVAGAYLFGDGVLAAPSVYDNYVIQYTTKSYAGFGEAYYDFTSDLKLTLGARYTIDDKTNLGQQATLACPAPIGLNATQIARILTSPVACPATPLNPYGYQESEPLSQSAQFDALTGRAVLSWTPQVSFTDKTMVYTSFSHGNRPGGFNPPSFIPGLIPNTFAPENVDDYEIGTKNTLLNGTLQADLTGFYYDYKGYQIAEIVNRSALNTNINSTIYGGEGELVWAPESHWMFNLNFGFMQSSITGGEQVDTRNPTHGNPDAIVLKDYEGSNCVIQNNAGLAPSLATFNAQAQALGYGNNNLLVSPSAQLPTSVAAESAFINGSGNGQLGMTCANLGSLVAAMNTYLHTNYSTSGGIPVSIKGNQMPNTPPVNISIGAQYTFDVAGGYALVPRVDYYWKSTMYSSIFNTAEDKIQSWGELNAQVQLNAPDDAWYGRVWIKNAMNSQNVTGTYTGDDAQGLFTNEFYEDPRTYGITVGAHF